MTFLKYRKHPCSTFNNKGRVFTYIYFLQKILPLFEPPRFKLFFNSSIVFKT